MRFTHFGPGCLVLLLALALVPASFADIAAPPPSNVTVRLTNSGANFTGIGEITYDCTVSLYSPTAQKDFPLLCSAGICTNVPEYTGSECGYYPEGHFSYEYQGRNMESETFNNSQFYRYYVYQLDVPTGKLTLVSASNDQNPQPGPCATAFLLAAALAVVAFRRG